jgi:hypothetical protein
MIRRILHAELSDVRAKLAAIIDRYTFVDHGPDFGVACIADAHNPPINSGVGVGYCLDNPERSAWPDGARLLTVGRVTLAAWGGRSS